MKAASQESSLAAGQLLDASEELTRQSQNMRQFVTDFIGGIKAA